MCFSDYKKAFDCVDHEIVWKSESGSQDEFGETEEFEIEKGVRPCCITSPLLFNIYADIIMREDLDKWEGGIGIGGRVVRNLRYADDTTIIHETKEDLIESMQ